MRFFSHVSKRKFWATWKFAGIVLMDGVKIKCPTINDPHGRQIKRCRSGLIARFARLGYFSPFKSCRSWWYCSTFAPTITEALGALLLLLPSCATSLLVAIPEGIARWLWPVNGPNSIILPFPSFATLEGSQQFQSICLWCNVYIPHGTFRPNQTSSLPSRMVVGLGSLTNWKVVSRQTEPNKPPPSATYSRCNRNTFFWFLNIRDADSYGSQATRVLGT